MKNYKDMRDKVEEQTESDGLIEGRNAVTEALKAGTAIDKIYLAKGETDHTLSRIAANAKKAGLDGVVCSPLEAGKVHDTCGADFLTITPGVRFADGDIGDQKRVMTPAAAKEIGSDYIVVGRPITAAVDPVAAYERCVAEFCD